MSCIESSENILFVLLALLSKFSKCLSEDVSLTTNAFNFMCRDELERDRCCCGMIVSFC